MRIRWCIIIFNFFSGTLLIVDNEEEFFPAEINKLAKDVAEHGLSILVFAGKQNCSILKYTEYDLKM